MTDDDLAPRTSLDRAARLLGRGIFKFYRLGVPGRAAVLVVLILAVFGVARACNTLFGPDEMSLRAGTSDGYQMGLSVRGPVTEAYISDTCNRLALIASSNGDEWTEGGVLYSIKGDAVDQSSYVDGCVDGFKAALRGDPAP